MGVEQKKADEKGDKEQEDDTYFQIVMFKIVQYTLLGIESKGFL